MNADRKLLIAVLLVAGVAVGQTPQGVVEMFRVAAEGLAERNVPRFLEQFDPAMKDYERLRQRVTLLVATEGAESGIEVVRDEGDSQRRQMQIDWVLRVGAGAARRRVLNITVERRERGWKITGLEPIDFF